jgi:hypothetical protein
MLKTISIVAAAGIASAASASITFDLSGVDIDGATVTSFTQMAGGPAVASIEWDLGYGPAAGSLSWTEELAIELVAPGASADGFAPGVGDGDADGNIHFGTTPIVSGFNAARDINADINLGGTADTGVPLFSSGTSTLLAGQAGAGTWTLNISEIFDDSGVDGEFTDGSFIRVNFVPAPGAAALFGLGGLAAARRRR